MIGNVVRTVLAGLALPVCVGAQSLKDLAAFSALIVSPVGALPPIGVHTSVSDQTTVSIRYGSWRYDIDDGSHNNFGITASQRIGHTRTTVSLTAALLTLNCGCSKWASGGVGVKHVLWGRGGSGESARSVHAALDLAVGGARYTGAGHARALSAASTLAVGVGLPLFRGMRLTGSFMPGIGFGRFESIDESASGFRPLLGAAASVTFRRGVSLSLGLQRVVLSGGPTQFGLGLSWHRR